MIQNISNVCNLLLGDYEMRVGIIRCESRAINCPGTGCFRAINEKEGSFNKYDNDIELVGFTTCGGCPVDNTNKNLNEIEILLNHGAEIIHFSNCFLSNCPFTTKIKESIKETHPDIKLSYRTHSDKLSWVKIKDQYPRVIE
jgi:predicted metal-binding protein